MSISWNPVLPSPFVLERSTATLFPFAIPVATTKSVLPSPLKSPVAARRAPGLGTRGTGLFGPTPRVVKLGRVRSSSASTRGLMAGRSGAAERRPRRSFFALPSQMRNIRRLPSREAMDRPFPAEAPEPSRRPDPCHHLLVEPDRGSARCLEIQHDGHALVR